MGHKLESRIAIGMVNAIMILPDGRFAGGADPRGDNDATGF
jgi:gamma-glutamyltranspeptidase/glutathione hydrolase